MKKYLWVAGIALVALIACKPAPEKKAENQLIQGVVTVAPALAKKITPENTVYIIAKPEMGPPLAVKKMTNVAFPLDFALTDADSMMPGMKWDGTVKIVARIDKDGAANPLSAGDLWGEVLNNKSQAEKVAIVIDKEFTK